MDDATFSGIAGEWMPTGANQLKMMLSSGSGICRLVDVPATTYETGFVSPKIGSFKQALESGNWGGTDWTTCLAESQPTGTPIYEVTRFDADMPAINGFGLPQELIDAIYADKDLPSPAKFNKSIIIADYVKQYLPVEYTDKIYFPSRRQPGGGVLMFNPKVTPTTVIYTGQLPPPDGVIDW